MGRLFKYFQVLALWLAIFAMGAHMVVIHDHHAEIACSSGAEKCPASEDTSSHHPDSPIHCHAFNDVASEKAVSFQFQSKIQCYELIFSIVDDGCDFDLILGCTFYPIPQTPYRSPHLRYASALRAPPSFS